MSLSPLSISLTYCVLSVAWILLSDRFTDLIPDRSVAQQVQSVKGIAFVMATTTVMFALIARYRARLVQEAEEVARRRAEILSHASRISPVFQPIVDMHHGATVGFEALSRFEDGAPPARRFAEAVEAGIGPEVELMAIQRALIDAVELPYASWLSINVSASLLLETDRLAALISEVERTIVMELTEQEAITDYEALRRAVDALGPRVRLAIDDVGEAFAGLRHLVELDPAYAKVDMALVRDIDADPSRQALVAALGHYVAETGAVLIAEGVETGAEREALTSLGVSLGQGFMFGRPATVHELDEASPERFGPPVARPGVQTTTRGAMLGDAAVST